MEYTIYKIICKDENVKDCYVGSTKDFNRRKKTHEKDLKHRNHKLQTTINNNGGWDNWNMLEIEKIICNKKEALIKEQFWINEFQSSLNSQKSHITNEERKERNKLYTINYNNSHREQIHNYNKNYRIKNIDEIKLRDKKYYEANKDNICKKNQEYSSAKITCECGKMLSRCSLSKHKKSKQHLTYTYSHQEQDEGHTDIVVQEV
jgi:hypothetical protein